jgi:UDP-2,3-diacylglucosamine pyrophosphatase LpxH
MNLIVKDLPAGRAPAWRGLKFLQDRWSAVAHRRLTEAFEKARRVFFDDDSRFILFSDCHRGDNSPADEFAPNEALFQYALNEYYDAGFSYVEVGDGDELWKNRRFESVHRAHRGTFDLLDRFDREGRLHLVLGNHDIQGARRYRMKKGNLVAYEGLILQHRHMDQQIFVVHGHQADQKSDRFYVIARLLVRHIWRRLQLLGIGREPGEPVENRDRVTIRQRITDWIEANCQTVICGHTHMPAFPLSGAAPYFNTGSCLFLNAMTGLEIAGGEIGMVKWSSVPQVGENGAVRFIRELMAPPRKLNLLRAW